MLFGHKKYLFFLVPLIEKRGIELRGFKTGMVLGLCIILGGRNRKAQKNVNLKVCRGLWVEELACFVPLVGSSFKTSWF